MAGKLAATLLDLGWLYRPTFPDSWRRSKLCPLARWTNGMAFRNINFSAAGRPVIKIAEIKNGISGQTQFTDADYYSAYLVREGDLLFSWSGQPESSIDAFWWRGPEGWLNQHVFKVEPDLSQCRSDFFFYLLKYLKPHFIGIARNKQTTGLGHVTRKDLEEIEVGVPDKALQRAIAHILGTLDDKIEMNRRMNETLEAIARTIFKSWFVDFDPVIDNALRAGNPIPPELEYKAARRREILARAKAEGRNPGLPKPIANLFPDRFVDSELGPIPVGWRLAELCEIALVIDCLHSKKPERREKGLPLLQLWNIRDDGLVDMSDPFYIDESDYRIWISRMEASPGDCVITNVGRVAAVAQIPSGLKAALGRNMTGIRCKHSFPFPTFLIQNLVSEAMRDEIVRKIDTGTILDALNVRNIPRLRVILPQLDLLKKFEESTRPLRAKMESNLAHSRTLAALRDVLLPKLISGELQVNDAERLIGDATN